jgi:putative serine protease PepD
MAVGLDDGLWASPAPDGRPASPASGPAAGSPEVPGGSPWWSDALADPWRDPDAAAVVVAPAPEPVAPPVPPPAPKPVAFTARWVALISIVAGMLAGAIGGAVGFAAATGRQHSVVLGAGGGAPPAPRVPGTIPDVVTRVLPSVMTVTASLGTAENIGSGFAISKDGYILTNEHVVHPVPDNQVSVTFSDGTQSAASVVGRDPESDIAVLHVDRANLTPVFIGNSDTVSVGDGVFAVGTPLGLPGTVTAGVVSALDRTIEATDVDGVDRYYAAIQTDAAVNRGNSGGPLFDYAGRVIGINSMIKSVVENGQDAGNIGIAFAIPINQAMRVASQIIDTGEAHRTVVGAQVDAYDGPGGGARITAIDSAGPAAAAGLRDGDVVVRIDSHVVEQPPDLIAMVRRYDPGRTVTIVYRRGSATQVASVVLAQDAN